MSGRDARGARARPFAARPLSLIHTNKSPNPIGIGVSGRLDLERKPMFFVGLLNSEDFDLVETLPEAMAIKERLLQAGQGPVVMMRLQPKRGANGAT